MSYTTTTYHENGSGQFRKKVKGLSLLETSPIWTYVWIPRAGEVFVLVAAYYRRINLSPSNPILTASPYILITRYGEGASVSAFGYISPSQKFVVGNPSTNFFTHDVPLVINRPYQQSGSVKATVWDYELILVATKVSH